GGCMAEAVTTLVQSAMPSGGRVLGEALRLTVLPLRTLVHFRLDARSPKASSALRIAGRSLPKTPNTWIDGDPIICRLAPDTWWLVSAVHEAAVLEAAVRAACGKRPCAIVDLTDAHVTLALEGPHAASLLARGCGLDFSPTIFGATASVRTRMAQLPVMIRRTTHERFEVIVDRSVAQYLLDWMQDAATGLD
ncbi:MAG: sarcosine oxidase subunit gamma, partial [Candidatus Binataceae bacterium]